MTSPLSPEREAEIRARAAGSAVLADALGVADLLAEVDRLREELAMAEGTSAALDRERAENQRLQDAIHDEAVLLSKHAVAARDAELHEEAELADATAFRLRAALAAPTPEETP